MIGNRLQTGVFRFFEKVIMAALLYDIRKSVNQKHRGWKSFPDNHDNCQDGVRENVHGIVI
jgi:hypothetical protein